jgi:hypothetical protein
MPKTITKTVYLYQELNKNAQAAALARWSSNAYFDTSDAVATFDAVADVLGIKIKDWSVGGYYDYVKFTRPADAICNLTGSRALAYVWNNYGGFWSGKYYSTRGKYINGRYTYKCRRSKVVSKSDDCPLTGYYMDCAVHDALKKAWSHKNGNAYTIDDFITDIEHNLARMFTAEYNDFYSPEHFAELCEINDWYFYEDGKIFA